jgi:molecular chaperone DnaJ
MNYYEVLGVPRDASQEEISKAFHRLAKKYHPDRPGGNSDRFKEINEAYQILSNKEKREQYDRFGRVFSGGQPGFDPSGDFSRSGAFWQDFKGFDADGFDGFNMDDLFGEMFGFQSTRPKGNSRRGQHVTLDIEIDLEDTLYGKDKEITVARYTLCDICRGRVAQLGSAIQECKICRGTGQVQELHKIFFGTVTRMTPCPQCSGEGKLIEKPCQECEGEGRKRMYEKMAVRIPAGAISGEEIRYEGKGDAGKRGAGSGDLLVRVFVREHSRFVREGDNVYIKVPVNYSQAVLGEKIEVPTLEGSVTLKIPPGIDSGKILRLKGLGIPRTSGYGRGDELVEIIVRTPKSITKEQKKILEELRKQGL